MENFTNEELETIQLLTKNKLEKLKWMATAGAPMRLTKRLEVCKQILEKLQPNEKNSNQLEFISFDQRV